MEGNKQKNLSHATYVGGSSGSRARKGPLAPRVPGKGVRDQNVVEVLQLHNGMMKARFLVRLMKILWLRLAERNVTFYVIVIFF